MIRHVAFDQKEALYSLESTRQIERLTASLLPPHTLMTRAGLAVAQLSRAVHPHARCIWVACGTGNNGGDGLVAATVLHRWAESTGNGVRVIVTHGSADPAFTKALPHDAQNALNAAREAGVTIQLEPPAQFDLAIDALLGMGAMGPVSGVAAQTLALLRSSSSPVLCVDLPSGLLADTGVLQPLPGTHSGEGIDPIGPRYTLSLLTLKPGLFTKDGRDSAGEIWFDDLQALPQRDTSPMAWLFAETPHTALPLRRPHASHKGSFGDVLVLGGQGIATYGEGMTGAAILAATAALHAGAGRVFVSLLGEHPGAETRYEPLSPELMFRTLQRMLESDLPDRATVVCGCGGGEAVAATLPPILTRSQRLVLDADALNAIARDPALQAQLTHRSHQGWLTVLTPHPLEAARLLGTMTEMVMQDRLAAAQGLADRFGAICVLKGSGSIVAAPGGTPWINASGNGRLATAGTGDVLAGMIGAALAAPGSLQNAAARNRVASAVYQHGKLADNWGETGLPSEAPAVLATLTASRLA
ncbi:MAG TPA: NAD(P)H-hydrate dehydratase, partial [Hydrogenophaga sp.]|nr:NAD(P)H-hydrate dehydratase [Hydrogenophaga sp.]